MQIAENAEVPPVGDMPRLKFSLAGVQLKFSSVRQGGKLTLPARGSTGSIIAKLPREIYPDLPEIEFSAMKLAEAAGVNIAECELLPSGAAQDIPKRLRHGRYVLAVKRFDRAEDGSRIHIEDFSQVMGAAGDQKYTRANEESVVNTVKRLAAGGMAAVEQAIVRIAVNILLGNTDAHLKNWSFIFARPNQPDLAPAYDIVSIALLDDEDLMALKLRGTNDPKLITVSRFASFASYVGMTEAKMQRVLEDTVTRAADTWPQTLKSLPLSSRRIKTLNEHWKKIALGKTARSPFRAN
jgi:serine/threonine-protein kinase HipA